jgi:hydrogenase maturation protease
VARRLRARLPGIEVVESEGEPTRLIDMWSRAESVVVVDAAHGTGPAGAVTRFDVVREPLPSAFFRMSTHHVSLGETVELARALGILPRQTTVVAIEAAGFELGEPLSPEVAAAIDAAVEEVVRCTSGS